MARLTVSQLTRDGAFRPPVGNWDYSFGGLSYRASSDSLFAMHGVYGCYLSEISIPALSLSTTWSSLITATQIQGERSAFEGRIAELVPGYGGGQMVGSGVCHTGSTLLLSGWYDYDAMGSAAYSHFTRSADLSTTVLERGPMTVSYPLGPAIGSGGMADIPAEWHAALGQHTMLSGLGPCPIITRTSQGPALFAWNASDMIAGTTPVPSVPLVYYTSDHPTLGTYGGTCAPDVRYCTTDTIAGMACLDGTATVAVFGTHSTGNYGYGIGGPYTGSDPTSCDAYLRYAPGTHVQVGDLDNGGGVNTGNLRCYDPLVQSKGEHAYPYYPWVWLYDVNDLARAASGAVQPWEVVPYEDGLLSELHSAYTIQNIPGLWGVGYDRANKRIFIAESGGTGTQAVIHVYRHEGADGIEVTPPPADTALDTATVSQLFHELGQRFEQAPTRRRR